MYNLTWMFFGRSIIQKKYKKKNKHLSKFSLNRLFKTQLFEYILLKLLLNEENTSFACSSEMISEFHNYYD